MSELKDEIRERMAGLEGLDGIDPWTGPRPSSNGKEVHESETGRIRVELICMNLRVAGSLEVGSFGRLSDFLNVRDAVELSDVVMLAGLGQETRVAFPELRVRLADISIVGQREESHSDGDGRHRIAMEPRKLVIMTVAHMVTGSGYIHAEAALASYMDSTDQRFMALTDVQVRWLPERRLAARYPFALVQRRHVIGVALEGGTAVEAPSRNGELPAPVE